MNFDYGCEKLFLALREEHKLKDSENKIMKMFGPTRDEVAENRRVLYNEGHCDLYRSSSIV
jgi:hypothetical protein